MSVKNAQSLPEVYYGLHFSEGLAEYAEAGRDPYRILINENTIKSMNPSFTGKPVYVDHVDEVNLENLQAEADGYVVDSFYNKSDGKCWVRFIVVSDRGKQAIRSGWKLSNAYIPKSFSGGGLWHGVQYEKEVTAGEYEHLAIVKNPRYEESMILTPEQFKQYNGEKEVELTRLANSKENKKMALKFWKRAKVENSADMEGLMIELPKSKKEMSLVDVISEFDTFKNMQGYASPDHMVKVGNDEMSVNDLVKKHMDMCNEMEEMKKPKAENDGEGEPGAEVMDEKKNDDAEAGTKESGEKDVGDRGGDKAMNKEDEEEKEVKKNNSREKAAALKNAGPAVSEPFAKISLSMDQVARGKARYGSGI